MAKTAAENQKAYREREKAEGPEFLQNARLRAKQNYVPTAQLSNRKLKERNRRNMLRNRLSRLKKKMRQNEEVQVENMSDTGYNSMHVEEGPSENVSPMIVRLPAIVKTNASKAKGLKKSTLRRKPAINKLNAYVTKSNQNLVHL